MRKSIAWLLLSVLVLGVFLTGCKEEKDNSLPQIGIFLKGEAQNVHNEWKAKLEEDGYQVNIFASPVDQAQQITRISDCIKEEYRLMIVDPVINAAAEDICKPVLEAGIPIIIINFEYAFPNLSGPVCFIGKNDSAPGLLQGELVQRLPEKGDINHDGTTSFCIIAGPADQVDVQTYLNGIQQTMKNETQLSITHTESSAAKGYDACLLQLSDFGKDLEVILCSSAELAEGVCKACIDAGRTPGIDLHILATGLTEGLEEWIYSGEVYGTVVEDLDGINKKVLEVAQAMLNGNEYQAQYFVSHKPLVQSDLR